MRSRSFSVSLTMRMFLRVARLKEFLKRTEEDANMHVFIHAVAALDVYCEAVKAKERPYIARQEGESSLFLKPLSIAGLKKEMEGPTPFSMSFGELEPSGTDALEELRRKSRQHDHESTLLLGLGILSEFAEHYESGASILFGPESFDRLDGEGYRLEEYEPFIFSDYRPPWMH